MDTDFQKIIKNRYYKGKLLCAEDFKKEQEYNQNSRNRSHALLHGKGIINGLTVMQKEDNRILITKGYCIDTAGQLISVPEDRNLKLEEIDGFEMTTTNQLNVSICYREIECQARYATISNRDDNMENNYIQESYQILLQDSQRISMYDAYFEKCEIFCNQQIRITQTIPLYISTKDVFAITVHIENMTEYKHDVSFVYHLQSPNIINAKGQKRIIIHGKVKELEKEEVLTFYLKKDSTIGGSKYAHFILQTDRAIVVIDGVQYPLVCNYEKSLLLVENMPLFLNTIFQQEEIVEDTTSFVKVATILIQRSMQETKVLSIQQNDDLYIYANRLQRKVKEIINLYGIQKEEVRNAAKIEPTESMELKTATSGILALEVPGYRRHQEPICTKEIAHGLQGRVQMSWSLEKKENSYSHGSQSTEQYYGDTTLFPETEQQNYQIACKVIESKQTFKFAIKAKRNSDHSTVYLRWYATLIEENEESPEKDGMIKIQPEFAIVKPEQSIVFAIVFEDPKQTELCDFSIIESNEGTINEDGKYIAPKNNGIYKIIAVGRESNKVAKAIVVVKDENT